jgi:hypothetical protein
MMEEARHSCNNDFFMKIFIVEAWQIWKERNNFMFNRANPSLRSWKLGFIDEVVLQANRMRTRKLFFLVVWICTEQFSWSDPSEMGLG